MAKISFLKMTSLYILCSVATIGAGGLATSGSALAADLAVQTQVTAVDMTDNFRFSPQTVTVQAGDTVVWLNTSRSTHTVTSSQTPAGAAAFDSGSLQPNTQFSQTFTVPGEYRYYCAPHREMGMVGTVIVQR